MLYKNTSNVKKTFHGVTFKPGEIKDSPKYINDPEFERANEMPKEPPRSVDSAKSTAQKQESKDIKQDKEESK